MPKRPGDRRPGRQPQNEIQGSLFDLSGEQRPELVVPTGMPRRAANLAHDIWQQNTHLEAPAMPAVVRYARQLLLHDQLMTTLEIVGTVDEATGKARPEFAQMTALAKELSTSERNLALSVRARRENLTLEERRAATDPYAEIRRMTRRQKPATVPDLSDIVGNAGAEPDDGGDDEPPRRPLRLA